MTTSTIFPSVQMHSGMASCGVSNHFLSSSPSATSPATLLPLHSRRSSRRLTQLCAAAAEHQQQQEVRVCTKKTCRKDGSLNTLLNFQELAPASVTVETTGCIGKCGSGPNVLLLPKEKIISHCETAEQAAFLLERQFGVANPEVSLQALELRRTADKALLKEDFKAAEALLTQAIDLKPSGGLHLAYAARSSVRLKGGNFSGAVADAREAAAVAPFWATAHVREGDAFLAAGQEEDASAAFGRALKLDPSLKKSKGFQKRLKEGKPKVASVKS